MRSFLFSCVTVLSVFNSQYFGDTLYYGVRSDSCNLSGRYSSSSAVARELAEKSRLFWGIAEMVCNDLFDAEATRLEAMSYVGTRYDLANFSSKSVSECLENDTSLFGAYMQATFNLWSYYQKSHDGGFWEAYSCYSYILRKLSHRIELEDERRRCEEKGEVFVGDIDANYVRKEAAKNKEGFLDYVINNLGMEDDDEFTPVDSYKIGKAEYYINKLRASYKKWENNRRIERNRKYIEDLRAMFNSGLDASRVKLCLESARGDKEFAFILYVINDDAVTLTNGIPAIYRRDRIRKINKMKEDAARPVIDYADEKSDKCAVDIDIADITDNAVPLLNNNVPYDAPVIKEVSDIGDKKVDTADSVTVEEVVVDNVDYGMFGKVKDKFLSWKDRISNFASEKVSALHNLFTGISSKNISKSYWYRDALDAFVNANNFIKKVYNFFFDVKVSNKPTSNDAHEIEITEVD